MNKIVIALLLVVTLSSCSTRMSCRAWKAQGKMFATLDSCEECFNQLGGTEVQTIQGCALGLDAAKLMSGRPDENAPTNRF